MELIFNFAAIIQAVAISLGVGCSTLAILNFFAAIKDGIIDETERNLMGIVYVVLRIAMVLILLTTAVKAAILYAGMGDAYFTPPALAAWTLIGMLYLNAILMTKRIMPSTFGPAIQAGSWYTLGILTALIPLKLTGFTYFQFLVAFVAAVALATTIVNSAMAYMKSKQAIDK